MDRQILTVSVPTVDEIRARLHTVTLKSSRGNETVSCEGIGSSLTLVLLVAQ